MRIVIKGTPRPKQSFRFGYNKYIGRVVKYQDKKVKAEEANIRSQIANSLPSDFRMYTDAVKINRIVFVFPPLGNFPQWKLRLMDDGTEIYKTTSPDLTDNLQKGLIDAMKGLVFSDDAIICTCGQVKKVYGREPRTEIELEEFKGVTDKSGRMGLPLPDDEHRKHKEQDC
jgi:Holliday junction resolvase RusA-like endonuclease